MSAGIVTGVVAVFVALPASDAMVRVAASGMSLPNGVPLPFTCTRANVTSNAVSVAVPPTFLIVLVTLTLAPGAMAVPLGTVPAMRPAVVELAGSETPAAVASAVEFVLEGLHLSKRLNKDAVGTKATYRGRG